MIDCYLVELGYWKDYHAKEFKRYLYVPENLYKRILRERYPNRGLFKTVYSYNNPNIDEAYMYGDFYLDFDDENNIEKVREDAISTINLINQLFRIPKEDINIFFSGSKGFHLTVDKKILGVEPDKKLNIIYKHIAKMLYKQTKHKTIDMKIYDNKRLFRLPNSQHEKTNLYKIQISYQELVNLSHDQLSQLARNPRELSNDTKELNVYANKMYLKLKESAIEEFEKILNGNYFSNVTKTIKDTPPCIMNLLEEGPIDGTKNNTLAILTSFYKSKGLSYRDTYNLVLDWSNGSIPEGEFRRTVNSIYNSEKRYGCRSLKIYSICDYNACPLMKGRRKS